MLRSQARRREENEDKGEGGRIQGTSGAVRRGGREQQVGGARRQTSFGSSPSAQGTACVVDAGALEF